MCSSVYGVVWFAISGRYDCVFLRGVVTDELPAYVEPFFVGSEESAYSVMAEALLSPRSSLGMPGFSFFQATPIAHCWSTPTSSSSTKFRGKRFFFSSALFDPFAGSTPPPPHTL